MQPACNNDTILAPLCNHIWINHSVQCSSAKNLICRTLFFVLANFLQPIYWYKSNGPFSLSLCSTSPPMLSGRGTFSWWHVTRVNLHFRSRVNVSAHVVIHFLLNLQEELCLVRTLTLHVTVIVPPGHVMTRHVSLSPPSLVTNHFLLLLKTAAAAPPLYNPATYHKLRTATIITSHRMRWTGNIPMPTGNNYQLNAKSSKNNEVCQKIF